MARCAAPIVAMAMSAAVMAQQPGSRATREFVDAAGQSNAFEMLEAATVLAESKDAQVRDYARKMIDAHRATTEALRRATVEAGVAPPPAIAGADQAPMLAALQSLRGSAFDRAYIRQQALAHRSALTVEQGYAARGDTPAIRRAAAAAVPIITAHLSMAEQIATRLETP